MGWDLEAVQIERCEKMNVMRMAQAMVNRLGWMHVDWVHSHGALLVCAFTVRPMGRVFHPFKLMKVGFLTIKV